MLAAKANRKLEKKIQELFLQLEDEQKGVERDKAETEEARTSGLLTRMRRKRSGRMPVTGTSSPLRRSRARPGRLRRSIMASRKAQRKRSS